jgi:hypothetical protein
VISAALGLAFVASSCASGLAFRQDNRLEILTPPSQTRVTLPVTVSWRIEGFRITGPVGSSDPSSGYFGVFVDRAPVPPGKAVSWIARDDKRCGQTPGCPDATYLADRGVYTTQQTSITFERLPNLIAYRGHEIHEVTIVLLDGMSHRIGESAWYVTMRYDRRV